MCASLRNALVLVDRKKFIAILNDLIVILTMIPTLDELRRVKTLFTHHRNMNRNDQNMVVIVYTQIFCDNTAFDGIPLS